MGRAMPAALHQSIAVEGEGGRERGVEGERERERSGREEGGRG